LFKLSFFPTLKTGLRKGHAPEYRNTFHAFVKIFKQEKIQGLYRG